MTGCGQYYLFTEVCRAIVCVLIVVSNALTIFTMLKAKGDVGKKGRLYIINLSIADSLTAPPIFVDLVTRRLGVHCFIQEESLATTEATLNQDLIWAANRRRWVLVMICLFYFVSLGCSIFTLFMIAVDRLTAITFPLFYRNKITTTRIKLAIASTWVYTVLGIGGLLMVTGSQTSNERVMTVLDPVDVMPDWYHDYFALPHTYFALSATGIAYVVTAVFMRKSQKQLQQLKKQKPESQVKDNKRTVRYIKMAAVTMAVMVVLWVPHMIAVQAIDADDPNTPMWLIEYGIFGSYTILFCNAWVNPLIYCAMNADFRRAYLKALGFGKNSVEPVSSTSGDN